MKIAIVIVNYNTPSDVIDCLESIKSSDIPKQVSLETIIVDNGSTDDSVDIFTQKYPEVKLIEARGNVGFTGGNNLGIREALNDSPTHVLLLNPDTIVAKDFFKAILDSAINQSDVGILTPLIYFAPGFEFHKHYSKKDIGKVIWSAGGSLDWNNIYGTNAHVDEVDHGQFTDVSETDFATGACMLIKRAVINDIGLIDDRYFLYLEDLEYSCRAKKANWKVMFDPSIRIWHKVSQSSGVGSSLNDYFITRNRLLFGLSYAKIRTKIALIREAFRFLRSGTSAQKLAVTDFFLHRFGKGSFIK